MDNECAGAVTTQQAVMLTRCTGSLLVKNTPQERMVLCDKVFSALESVGALLLKHSYMVVILVLLVV